MARALSALAIALLLTTSGCTADAVAVVAHRPTCTGVSPRATVTQYYHAIAHHKPEMARSCLAPFYLAQAAAGVDPDWRNIAILRHLRLQARIVPARYLPGNIPTALAAPYRAAQVTAQYVVRYYRVIDANNGSTIRFLYLIRQHRASPWRIVGIGSGP